MKLLKRVILTVTLFTILFFPASVSFNTSAAEESPAPVYYVRFSGTGLNVYGDPSLSGESLAILPDDTYVRLCWVRWIFLQKFEYMTPAWKAMST